jgi:hypothetical protein
MYYGELEFNKLKLDTILCGSFAEQDVVEVQFSREVGRRVAPWYGVDVLVSKFDMIF